MVVWSAPVLRLLTCRPRTHNPQMSMSMAMPADRWNVGSSAPTRQHRLTQTAEQKTMLAAWVRPVVVQFRSTGTCAGSTSSRTPAVDSGKQQFPRSTPVAATCLSTARPRSINQRASKTPQNPQKSTRLSRRKMNSSSYR